MEKITSNNSFGLILTLGTNRNSLDKVLCNLSGILKFLFNSEGFNFVKVFLECILFIVIVCLNVDLNCFNDSQILINI